MADDTKPGNGQTTDETPDELIITLTSRKPWQITIGGKVENMNLALAMLNDALREMETEWRIARGIAAQLKLKKEAQDAQMVNSILGTKFSRDH